MPCSWQRAITSSNNIVIVLDVTANANSSLNYFSDKKTMHRADCMQEKAFVNKYVVEFLVPENIYYLF